MPTKITLKLYCASVHSFVTGEVASFEGEFKGGTAVLKIQSSEKGFYIPGKYYDVEVVEGEQPTAPDVCPITPK